MAFAGGLPSSIAQKELALPVRFSSYRVSCGAVSDAFPVSCKPALEAVSIHLLSAVAWSCSNDGQLTRLVSIYPANFICTTVNNLRSTLFWY